MEVATIAQDTGIPRADQGGLGGEGVPAPLSPPLLKACRGAYFILPMIMNDADVASHERLTTILGPHEEGSGSMGFKHNICSELLRFVWDDRKLCRHMHSMGTTKKMRV